MKKWGFIKRFVFKEEKKSVKKLHPKVDGD